MSSKPAQLDELDLGGVGRADPVFRVGDLDVLGDRGDLLVRAQLDPPLGHDQSEADRIHGHRILPDDEALVVPDVAAAEVVRAAAVELRGQGAEDVQPRLALDLGQEEERAERGAAVGVVVRLGLGEHDVVLEAARHPGQVVRPDGPDVDQGRGLDEERVRPHGVVVEPDVRLGDAGVHDPALEGLLDRGGRRQEGPDVGLDADDVLGLDEPLERLDRVAHVEELRDGLVQHLPG